MFSNMRFLLSKLSSDIHVHFCGSREALSERFREKLYLSIGLTQISIVLPEI